MAALSRTHLTTYSIVHRRCFLSAKRKFAFKIIPVRLRPILFKKIDAAFTSTTDESIMTQTDLSMLSEFHISTLAREYTMHLPSGRAFNLIGFARAVEKQALERVIPQGLTPAVDNRADDWRVGEFWSSSTPGTKVLMLSRAGEIEEHAAHKSFIRWVGMSSTNSLIAPAGIADKSEMPGEQARTDLHSIPIARAAPVACGDSGSSTPESVLQIASTMGREELPPGVETLAGRPTTISPAPTTAQQAERCALRLCCRADAHVADCTTYDPDRYPDDASIASTSSATQDCAIADARRLDLIEACIAEHGYFYLHDNRARGDLHGLHIGSNGLRPALDDLSKRRTNIEDEGTQP